MHNKWTLGSIFVILFVSLFVILLGFNNKKYGEPTIVYTVYLDGKEIGLIEDKTDFEAYINEKEENIKTSFGVDTVYEPIGVEIKKTVTYNEDIESNDSIYNKIISEKKFTIKGVIVTITHTDGKKDIINVLSKDIFDEALTNTIKAFVDTEKYEKYMSNTQEEIVDTGSVIENIDLQDSVTYKEGLISTDETIFIDTDTLAKYLLYGTLNEQETYIVQSGDTIEDVASNHKLNVREFLIANPEFSSENNLLYENQKVVVGLVNPIINVVVDVHSVEEEEKAYETEIQYDSSQYVGYQEILRDGENGLYKMVRKYQYINGQLVSAVVDSSAELKPSVNRIMIKGDKYAPSVADLSYWSWPTATPYTITTYFEYRWGSFHSAIDIYVGYGSPIYSANNGEVYDAKSNCYPGDTSCNGGRGNYIVVRHNAGNYYTQYMHLNSVNVSIGQTVARGQQIATMGNTGYVVPTPSSYNPYGGTHLDFSVFIGIPYQGGYAINPFNLY